MTAPPPVVPAPWPHRWILTMLLPVAVGIAALTGLVVVLSGDAFVSLCAAAALLAAAYLFYLVRVARWTADQRRPPVSPAAAFRHDLPRCLGSVAARSAGVTLLGLVARLDPATAVALGLLVGLTVGWVQLVRQAAIVLTFSDATP